MKKAIFTALILLISASTISASPDKPKKKKRKKSGFTSIYGQSRQSGRNHYGCFSNF